MRESCEVRRVFGRTDEVEDSLVYKPWLGNLWNDIVQEELDNNLADDEALWLWVVVFWRKTDLKDMVYYLTVVFWINRAIW